MATATAVDFGIDAVTVRVQHVAVIVDRYVIRLCRGECYALLLVTVGLFEQIAFLGWIPTPGLPIWLALFVCSACWSMLATATALD